VRLRLATHAALVAAALAACAASLPVERRDYILSRPHGWVVRVLEPEARDADRRGKAEAGAHAERRLLDPDGRAGAAPSSGGTAGTAESAIVTDIEVAESLVTDVTFDGERLAAGAARADSAVTLESLYRELTGRPRPEP